MKRSTLLDLLRIVAIAMVFSAHFGQLLDWPIGGFFGVKNFYYVSLGGVGVSLFLLLSGLLAGLGEHGRRSQFFTYVYKKCLRIYPLYWLSIPLSVIGYMLGERLLDGSWPTLLPNGFTTDVIGSITGFYAWMGLWGGPYNSPSWFIALIMTMYFAFPLLYGCILKAPHLSLFLLLLLSIATRYYVGQQGLPFGDPSIFEKVKGFFYRQYGFMPTRPADWFPLCRIFEFSLGIYLAHIVPRPFWFKLDIGFKRLIGFLSDHAFSLFLVHYPFLFLIVYLIDLGVHTALSIFIYLLVMMSFAIFMNKIDKHFPRKVLMLRR